VEFTSGDAYQLPFPDGMFDAVVISNALHVMSEPERARAEAHRTLKANGRLIVPTFCHGENFRSEVASRIISLVGFKAFQRWPMEGFVRFIEANGYEILRREVYRDVIPWFIWWQSRERTEMVEFGGTGRALGYTGFAITLSLRPVARG
jgi:ubiquinone/menaquinone biosynthesis C-methylase UbiE